MDKWFFRGKILIFGICLAGLLAAGCAPKAEQQQSLEMTAAGAASAENMETKEEKEEKEEKEGNKETADVRKEPVFGEFEACDVNREKVTQEIFSDFEVTMVYVWASYSEECIRQIADLAVLDKELQEYREDGKFQIVGIPADSLDQSGSASSIQLHQIRTILDETDANFLQVIPSYDLITAKLKEISSLPRIFFVDCEGVQIGEEYSGFLDLDEIRELAENHLKS